MRDHLQRTGVQLLAPESGNAIRIEVPIELLVEVVFELVVQLVLELIAELGISWLEGPVRRARRAHPAVIALGLLVLGGLVGALTAVLVPRRVLPAPPVPGVSLIVAPVLAGTMMYAYGLWRRSRGERASRLATFWGGAAFAVGFSAARFAMLAF